MLYSQVYMINKYLTTRDIIRDGRDPWAKDTTNWPTIVLLVTSAMTVLVTGIMLLAYAWGVKGSNWVAIRIYAPWIVIEILSHAGVWIATMVAYRAGKTGSDLWGWSCSDQAQGIQKIFPEVDFGYSCNLQSDAWFASIAQVILVISSGIAWTLAWQRHRHQKKIRARQSLLEGSEYAGAAAAAGPPVHGGLVPAPAEIPNPYGRRPPPPVLDQYQVYAPHPYTPQGGTPQQSRYAQQAYGSPQYARQEYGRELQQHATPPYISPTYRPAEVP